MPYIIPSCHWLVNALLGIQSNDHGEINPPDRRFVNPPSHVALTLSLQEGFGFHFRVHRRQCRAWRKD
ncbi:MAG: hypothetical protein HY360_18360 [Verrucomicrobia bacterium]|nr:hypothetical protein [Verrucomicrobiota bacterium]